MRRSYPPRSRFAALILLAASGALAAPDLTPAPGATIDTNLAPSQMLSQAKEYTSKMQDGVRTIMQLEELAKKQKDIIKLNCVRDKLLQVKGHLAVSDTAMANLNEAIARNDQDARGHEYTRVTILYQKVLVLGTEAGNCIGEDLSYVGETTVTVEKDPSIPDRDTTAFGLPTLDTSRPPAASLP